MSNQIWVVRISEHILKHACIQDTSMNPSPYSRNVEQFVSKIRGKQKKERTTDSSDKSRMTRQPGHQVTLFIVMVSEV